MDIMHCPNCSTGVVPGQRFCSHCGQASPVHRITVGHFIHEGMHALTHADKGIFHLLKSLATRPGTVAREYIQGRRKKYFNPFTFFIILMGLFVLSNTFFKNNVVQRSANPAVLQRIPTEAGRVQYVTYLERTNEIMGFFTKYGNMVAMVAVVLIALLTWLFYRRKGFNYAEHLTANLFFIAFMNLVFTVTIFPLQTVTRSAEMANILRVTGLLVHILYLWWALNGFLQLHTAGARLKSLGVSIFCLFVWTMLSMTIIALYIYRSPQFYKFFVRMMS